jgi:hypothetical protein
MTITLSQLWVLASLTGIFIVLALWLVRANDFWWHVRVGQWILDNGRIPTTDLFSFTRAGEPWAYQSWLMEVVFYLLVRAGALPLVVMFHALTITSAYGLLLRVNQRASGGDTRWAALATVAAAAIGVTNWNPRPQTVSFFLFGLTLFIIDRHQAAAEREATGPQPSGRLRRWVGLARVIWWLPPLFALWANAHGGFVFGFALLGLYLLAQLIAWARKRSGIPSSLLLVALLCGAATMLTPLGVGMVNYVLGFFRHPVTQTLNMEFMPPTVRTLDGQLFFGFLAIFIGSLLVTGYRPGMVESLRLVVFGGLALMYRRNPAWFGFVAAPSLAAAWHHWTLCRGATGTRSQGRPAFNRVLAALLVLLAVLSLPWLRPHLSLPEWRRAFVSRDTPVKAVEFLRGLPQPMRVFNEQGYGSYMIWASPEIPVFVDPRIELYPPEQWDDYFALTGARYDWEAIAHRYGVDTLLLRRDTQEPLVNAATADEDWEQIYEDEQSIIFLRNEGS